MKGKVRLIVAALVVVLVAGVALRAWLLREPFRYVGTIEATEVDISARVASAIDRVSVQEGDAVRSGQLLVTLACEDIKVSAIQAERDFRRAAKLHKDDWCTIRAPLDATVLTRYREPGELVSPGMKLLTLGDLRTPWAYVYVEQPMLARLRVGMDVTGFLPELGKRSVPGKIIKISDEAEFTPKNVQTREERTRLVYGVKIEFANPEGLLKPGMPIEVELGVQ
jgi:HlyD family secretion protein